MPVSSKLLDDAVEAVTQYVQMAENQTEQIQAINGLRSLLHDLTPISGQPVGNVQWIHHSQVQANDYNPNAVARNEMRLLYVSIEHDGYTQPIVTIYDTELERYIIVDGFHRYTALRNNATIMERCKGYLPVVVIDKDINDRMASTVRHNRARGKHSVQGMGQIVFDMLLNGADDATICSEIGLEPEELIRLKYVTGFAKLFEASQYSAAMVTDRQIEFKANWLKEHGGDTDVEAGSDHSVLAEPAK
jgi:hypothetical protein